MRRRCQPIEVFHIIFQKPSTGSKTGKKVVFVIYTVFVVSCSKWSWREKSVRGSSRPSRWRRLPRMMQMALATAKERNKQGMPIMKGDLIVGVRRTDILTTDAGRSASCRGPSKWVGWIEWPLSEGWQWESLSSSEQPRAAGNSSH
jgi:hypothetical protein